MPIECPLNICMKKVCISRANRNDAVDLTIKMEVIVSSFFGSTDSTDTSVATEEQEFTWRIPGYRKKRKQEPKFKTENGKIKSGKSTRFSNCDELHSYTLHRLQDTAACYNIPLQSLLSAEALEFKISKNKTNIIFLF